MNRTKPNQTYTKYISTQALEQYLRTTFDDQEDPLAFNDIRKHSKAEVDVRYRSVMSTRSRDKVISSVMVRRYISILDGIMTEHLKYAIDSQIPFVLSVILTMCVQFHVVPMSFTKGHSGHSGVGRHTYHRWYISNFIKLPHVPPVVH